MFLENIKYPVLKHYPFWVTPWTSNTSIRKVSLFLRQEKKTLKTLPLADMIDYVQQFKKKYGKIYRLWVLNQASVFILDVKYLEVVFGSQQMIRKSRLYDFIEGWLGRGLLMSWGKKWHSRRKIITPTFHFKILEQFVEIFDQQSTVMVKKLSEKADGKTEIDIFPVVCLCALDIITGKSNPMYDCFKWLANELCKHMKPITKWTLDRLTS